LAFEHGMLKWLYVRICKPRSDENAEFLKKINYFYSIGDGCRINTCATFTDPKYVRIGNNVCLSACSVVGHDGAVAVFSSASGKILDKVGKIDIGNNVFVGIGAILLPNITIGDNTIIAAGSIVSKDVAPGTIVGGIPAKVIGNTADYVNKIEEQTKAYPWYDMLKKRETIFDDNIEKDLFQVRIKHFFG
jgi:acetyltransferase-like isoleucine patch superfamily enzyme